MNSYTAKNLTFPELFSKLFCLCFESKVEIAFVKGDMVVLCAAQKN
jgi:hypothetical protein